MKAECPECKCRFQTIDVDGVMSERKLIHEILEESREVERLKSELEQMIDHCEMLQKARDRFDRECERLRGMLYESHWDAADLADEKPDGQAENI